MKDDVDAPKAGKRYLMIEHMKRGPFDEIETPPEAVARLVPFLDKNWRLWESAPISRREDAAGVPRSTLADELEMHGFTVRMANQDFFHSDPGELYDVQVTNPPFSIKHRWLRRSDELGKPWVLLLPVTTLGVRRCQPYLDGCEIVFFPKRIDFTGGKRPWFAVAWFTKGLSIGKQLVFG